MSKLHVHEKFINNDPKSYICTIAEYDLDNGNTLELWADENHDVFWINEFRPDGSMTLAKFDHAKTYDEGINILVERGEAINKQLIVPKPNRL